MHTELKLPFVPTILIEYGPLGEIVSRENTGVLALTVTLKMVVYQEYGTSSICSILRSQSMNDDWR